VFVTRAYSGEGHLNVGTGEDISIIELAGLIAKVVGWEGDYVSDPAMPDGTPRKLLDVSRLRRLGWSSTTSLHEGLRQTYRSFLNEYAAASG
jgi:GDP-L-fucose synthase